MLYAFVDNNKIVIASNLVFMKYEIIKIYKRKSSYNDDDKQKSLINSFMELKNDLRIINYSNEMGAMFGYYYNRYYDVDLPNNKIEDFESYDDIMTLIYLIKDSWPGKKIKVITQDFGKFTLTLKKQ